MWRRLPVIEMGMFLLAGVLAAVGYGWLDTENVSYTPGNRDESDLRVVTWNVGGREDKPMDPSSVVAVAESLAELSPDLVCLQEVRDRRQLDRLIDALDSAEWRGRSVRSGDRMVAILYARGSLSTWTVRTGGNRDAIAAIYRPSGRPAVAVINVHADAYSAESRNRDLGSAVEELISQRGADAKLLVGDFNLDIDIDKRRDLYTDDPHRDVESYNFVATHLFDAAIGGGSSAEPDRRLDYIFINERLAVVRAGVWRNRRVGSMDHNPVVADLRYVDR